jgi:hypothetical protein
MMHLPEAEMMFFATAQNEHFTCRRQTSLAKRHHLPSGKHHQAKPSSLAARQKQAPSLTAILAQRGAKVNTEKRRKKH